MEALKAFHIPGFATAVARTMHGPLALTTFFSILQLVDAEV